MTLSIPQLNFVCAWIGILLGFLSGMAMGLQFQKPDWLGGYASLKRRLYRLAHISFFGLAAINFLFYFTAREMNLDSSLLRLAARAFIIGAATMPVCCVAMAHFPRLQAAFAVPVLSLVTGAVCVLMEIVK